MTTIQRSGEVMRLLAVSGVPDSAVAGGDLMVTSPIDGSAIAAVRQHDGADLERMIAAAERAFLDWRAVPAPRRGELVRLFAEELRRHKDALGRLVTIEAGKIVAE